MHTQRVGGRAREGVRVRVCEKEGYILASVGGSSVKVSFVFNLTRGEGGSVLTFNETFPRGVDGSLLGSFI